MELSSVMIFSVVSVILLIIRHLKKKRKQQAHDMYLKSEEKILRDFYIHKK
jgi:hypothetical protein